MSFGREVKRRVRDALPPLGFAALCGYFAWHSVHGDYGLLAREQRLEDIAAARAVLARAEASATPWSAASPACAASASTATSSTSGRGSC